MGDSMKLMESLITGVVSGVCSSLLVLAIYWFFRPKVRLSDGISAKQIEPGKWRYQVKIVNLTRSILTNASYTLRFCKVHPDNIVEVQEILPLKSHLAIINKYDPKQKTANYAVRLSYEVDESIYVLDKDTKLEFTLFASHVLTNASICLKKEYFVKDIYKNSLFEHGKSTKIVINH